MHTFRGSSLYHRIQNPTIFQSLVSFNYVVISHQKGEIVSASSPLVGFGELNDNTIKGLTSLLSVEQLVSERLVSAEQHRLELVRSVELVAELLNQASNQLN